MGRVPVVVRSSVGRTRVRDRHAGDDERTTTGTTTSALMGRRSVPFIPPTLVRDAVEASRRVATVTTGAATTTTRREAWDVERGEAMVSGRGGRAVAAEDVETERMEATVPLTPTVRREDSAETADGARADHLGEDSDADADGVEERSGDSDEKGRTSRVTRKRRSMCDALLSLKARDVIAGLQIATLITLVALLYTATRAVDSFQGELVVGEE